jgi:phage host-nuclease inhibitor protein Gam
MSRKQTATTQQIPATRDELEAILAERARDVATLEQVIGCLEGQITDLRAKVQPTITAVEARIDEATKTVKAWADAHRAEFPTGSKSLELVHATLAYRTTPPAVALLRGWNEDKAVAHMAALGIPFQRFIRTKLELDRAAVLASSNADTHAFSTDGTDGVALSLVGLKIQQTERFAIDPREEVQAP